MSTDNFRIIVGLIGAATILGAVGLMADCSKTVALVDGERAADCVASGGAFDPTIATVQRGRCVRAKRP